MKSAATLGSPHRGIEPENGGEIFLLELLDRLWERYHGRVAHVRAYEKVVRDAGATFVNDHIAFRTIAHQRPAAGISSISRIFQVLGYAPCGAYHFPEKHLGAVHYQHPNPLFPKLFISELNAWELSSQGQRIVDRTLQDHRPAIPDEVLSELKTVESISVPSQAKLFRALESFFRELPWLPPQKKDVLAIDKECQYAAWVLVHGYDVNHFTASVNSHRGSTLEGIDQTVQALRKAGVPMKSEIEGAPGSKLRQSATEAVVISTAVREGKKILKMPWTYAYFEIAERGMIRDPETGQEHRFEGFLGGQAAQLFEMTRRKESNR